MCFGSATVVWTSLRLFYLLPCTPTSVADPWHFFDRDSDLRIRTVPLTNGSGSGSGSCYFRQKPSFKIFFFKVFLLIAFWSYINIIFQRWSHKKSRNSRNLSFSIFVWRWKNQDPELDPYLVQTDRIRYAQKHTDESGSLTPTLRRCQNSQILVNERYQYGTWLLFVV